MEKYEEIQQHKRFELHLIARIIQATGLALYMSTGSSVVSYVAEKKF